MGESPAGFSTMPASPEVAPEEASAKLGKRPGSAKAREGGPGGPGISKDAGEPLGIHLALQQISESLPQDSMVSSSKALKMRPCAMLQCDVVSSICAQQKRF